jgi:ketosteroid isomerase-like protein
MAHSNEELVRQAYDAFSNGDVDTLRKLFTHNVVFHQSGHGPLAGDYDGIDHVLSFFQKLAERSGGTFRVHLHDVLTNHEHAVGLHTAEAEREGRHLRSRVALVVRVRDRKIAEAWAYGYDQYADDAFWA